MVTFKSGFACIALSGVLAFTFLTYPALSAPSTTSHSVMVEQLLKRVLLLEERSTVLQKRVDDLQRQVRTLQNNAEHSGTLHAAGWVGGEDTECSEPFVRDTAGNLRVKPECLSALPAAPCTPPYSVTANGVRRVNTACVNRNGRGFCDPPFNFDETGEKLYHAECVKHSESR